MSQSKDKKQKPSSRKKDKKQKLGLRILIIISVILLVAVVACIFVYSGTESAKMNKAERIADNYMKSRYGASLEYDNIMDGFMLGADYTVFFKVSDTVTVYAGVSLEDKKVVYENYVRAYIVDILDQSYREKIASIWDRQAEAEFECNLFFEEDKYLLADKKIDYDRAIREEEFVLNISSDSFDLDQSAGAIYNTIAYLKDNDVKLGEIRYHDYSSGDYDSYKHYYLKDVDQFENADMVLEYLKNYKEE